jgi:1,4-alpha-glucan branching enzyme
MKRLFSLLALVMTVCFMSSAQIVTTSPLLLQESSENVVLTYNAASPLGNNGMKGLSSSTAVYAHIGVITDKSTSTSDWKYTVTSWPTSASDSKANTSKNKLTYVSTDTWKLTIGNPRTYFGITDANEHIQKIAIVFRNADGSKEGKTAAGGDIFVDVYEEGYQLLFSSDAESTILSAPATIKFTAAATQSSNISITVNGNQIASATGKTELYASYNFSSTGSYTVVATANNGSQTLTKSIDIVYPGSSQAGTYPGGVPQMGAVKNSDGTVTFCLAAPNKKSVVLVPSWDDYQVLDKNIMKYQDYNGNRYFWITVSGLNDNTYYPYYYVVDATTKVGDPYAHLVLDCYSDKWLDSTIWPDMPKYPYEKFDDVMLAVYRGDMDSSYKFSNFTIPDHSNLVIYELLFRDFTGTEGSANANGTIKKAIEKIPYLRSLGVNAVELMPVMEFNGNNSWGYNTNFYMALDKAYGSPKDLKDFVELCHQNGMAVILDIVFNQSDGLHPWYQMYSISSNPFYNATAPHDYSVLNDWKQENALVQQQWKDAITYWMTAYNVDGFRFDLVKGLGTSYTSGTEAYNSSRVTVMKNLHAAIKAVKSNGIHINENLAGSQEENEMAGDGQLNWANINYNSCQYAMGWGTDANLNRFLSTNDSRTWGSTVAYAESHDEERVAYKQKAYGYSTVANSNTIRMQRLGQLAVQMLLTPGPKMIWQFGELGADQTTKSGDSNDTSPKTVIWNYMNDSDRAALLETYKSLGWLRKENPELFTQSATFVENGFTANVTSTRSMRLTSGDKEIIAFINPNVGGANKTIGTSSTKLNANNCQLICASSGFTPTLSGTGTSVSVSVPPHGYAVYATKAVSGVDDVIGDSALSSVNVRGGQGEIIVDGEYNHINVYTIAGQAVGTTNLAAGLYIVNVDGTATKVLVK